MANQFVYYWNGKWVLNDKIVIKTKYSSFMARIIIQFIFYYFLFIHFLSSTGFIGDNDIPNVEQLESSPNFGPRKRLSQHKPRNLEMVITNNCKTFNVRDLDDSNDSCDSIAPPPLPQLPSAFNSTDNRKK